MARHFGIPVAAAEVDDEATERMASRCGCDLVQGPWSGAAAPLLDLHLSLAEELAELRSERNSEGHSHTDQPRRE